MTQRHRSPGSREFSEAETAVTPEMVEAGFSLLSFRYDPAASEWVRRGVVRDMYRAMSAARLEDSAGSD